MPQNNGNFNNNSQQGPYNGFDNNGMNQNFGGQNSNGYNQNYNNSNFNPAEDNNQNQEKVLSGNFDTQFEEGYQWESFKSMKGGNNNSQGYNNYPSSNNNLSHFYTQGHLLILKF